MARTLSTYSLLTYDELCRAVGQSTPGPSTGDAWESLLDVAERVSLSIERYLQRDIVTRGSLTEYHTVPDADPCRLFTRQWPFITIATINEGAIVAGAWTSSYLLTAADYVTEADNVIVRLSGSDATAWMEGFRRVRLVYQAGYASTAVVPQHIKDVAAKLTARMWAESKRGQAGAQSISDGMGSVTRFLPSELLTMERQALASERRYHTTGRAA
jgi:hypothetical protein